MQRAQAIRIHAYGGPEAMVLDEVEIAPPGPGEVLLRQHAVGINFHDTYSCRGVFPFPQLPAVLGCEAAGTVQAVGPDVDRVQVGNRVAYAGPPLGSYATHRVMPAAPLVRLPDAIGFDVAAAVMLQGMTAHMLLFRVRPVGPGDTVLVHGAAGGLGTLLCQWAHALGVRVLGTVGSAAKADFARANGCAHAILYKEQDFAAETLRLTDGAGVDVVYEGVGGDTLERSLGCLKPFGMAVNLGQIAGPLPQVDLQRLGPQRSLSVAVPGVFAHMRTVPDLQAAADTLFAAITSGAVRPHIGGAWPLAGAADAHRALKSGATTGALILETGV